MFHLKGTHYAHFQVHNFILGYNKNRCTCFSAQKTHQFSHIVQCCSSVFTLCLKRSVLAPVSLGPGPLKTQSPLIGQLTHA